MQKPGSLTVLTILNFIFGGWGVLGSLISLGMTLFMDATGPLFEQLGVSPVYRAWSIGIAFVGVFAAGLLIVAGVGLHKEQLWGRKLSLIYAVYTLVIGVISLGVTAVFFIAPLLRQLNAAGPQDAATVGGAIGGAVGGLVGSVLALIYPGALLFFLTRPHVVEYLRAQSEAAPRQP